MYFMEDRQFLLQQVLESQALGLVLVTFVLSSTLSGVKANLFVILLKSSKILSGLRELTLLHTLTNVPVDEGPLGVHQVELVVEPGPGFGDGGGVREHAHGPLHLGQVAAWHNGGRLVVNAYLETSRTPVNKLDAPLGLDGGNGSVHVLRHNVSSVEEATGHVLAVTGVALDHLVGWLEAGVGDLRDSELLMVGLLGRDDGCIGDQGEVDPGVGHQVGLELSQVHVQGSVEPQGCSDGGHNLSDQPVEVGVGWPLNVQVATADVVDGLVVNHEGAVGVLQGGVGGQDGVVGLDHSSGNLGSRVDGELKLALLAVVHGQPLHKQGRKARSGAASEGMEEKESLKSSTGVSELPNPVENQVDNLLSDRVVSSSVVVSGVLLSVDELLGMVQLTVGSASGLIDDSRLQIDEDCSWDVLASAGLGEEGLEGVIPEGLVRGHVSIWLDAVLKAVELPTGVTNLATGLADVDGDALTHDEFEFLVKVKGSKRQKVSEVTLSAPEVYWSADVDGDAL